MFSKVRGCAAAYVTVIALLAVPAESKAGPLADFFFGGWCGGTARTTYEAPYVGPTYAAPAYAAPTYAAPACTTCAPQTCHYVPQTCYRTVYQPVPVTTCQAITCCDPCTGCPVTTYRPVTAWTHQVRLVPFTTYRLAYSNPCVPCAAYGPCTSCGSVVYGAPGAGCGPCTGGVTTLSPVPQTTATTLSPVPTTTPSTSTPLLPTPSSPAETPPSLNTLPPRTFVPELGPTAPETKPTIESRLLPIPSTDTRLNSTPPPKLIDPENRTTLRPVGQASLFHLISSPSQPAAPQEAVPSDGGWRASPE